MAGLDFQVSPLKLAPFYELSAGLGSTNKSFISLLLLSGSRFVLATLSSPLFFLLPKTLWQIWQKLPSLSLISGYNGYPNTHLSLGTTRLISWPAKSGFSCLGQSIVNSLFLPLVSTLVFSRTGSVLFHLNSLTHELPWFLLRNLCSLVTLAVCSFVFAATDTAFCKALISLELAELRILHAAPADSFRTLHSALFSYRLFAPLALWRLRTLGSLNHGVFGKKVLK